MMSKDQGTKRLRSPGTANASNHSDDKRRRNDSIEIIEEGSSQIENMNPEEPSLTDIKTTMDTILARLKLTPLAEDIKNLVSKDDLKVIDDRITAQNQEIGQLREEIKTLKGNFETLQANVDNQTALNLATESRSLGRDPGYTTSNMATINVNTSRTTTSQRRNLVIEGLAGDTDPEIISNILSIAAAINVTLYAKEVEQVVRLNRRDENDKRPGPVVATLSRAILRDNVLKKKGGLCKVTGMDQVFVNADETLEIRKAKSFLRKAAYNAKRLGEVVQAKHNQVTINGVCYNTQDIEKIPAKYLTSDRTNDQENAGEPMEASGGVPLPGTKEGLVQKGERMKVTKKGLCFSGPNAYLSNMAYVTIEFNKRSFNSNEQGFQWRKAIDHQDPDLAAEIKETENSYEVKKAGKIITTSPEWNANAPDLLERLLEIKLDQHPELLERIIETYPLELIEASSDTTWGGGAPFNSEIYDSDEPLPGDNLFGKIATRVRNRRIRKMNQT